jgi:phosphate transport system substrate-binding protein
MTQLQVLISVVVAVLASCVHAEPLEPFRGLPVNGDVKIFSVQGSNTIGAALGPNLIKSYLERKGAVDIEVRKTNVENEVVVSGTVKDTRTRVYATVAAHGSSTGFVGLAQQTADIAAASRPIKSSEVSNLAFLGNMHALDSEHIVGIDGLAIIVNPANPVAELSVDEIAQIFSGGYTDWAQLGGRPGAIHIYARDENSGTWDSFSSMVLGDKKLLPSAQRFESNADLSGRVSKDANGIGFVGLSSVLNAKLIAVSDGTSKALKPNKLTVATEDYALARRLFMYTPAKPASPYVSEFIQFALHDDGQKVVADSGFVSQELQAVVPEFYAELPDDFREITNDAKRLTINFRFQEGSAKLDNKAMKDVERLVGYLQSDRKAEIVLIGFGDKKRTEKRSQLLSKLRAMAVRRELVRNGIYPKEAVGYGEYLPVASVNRAEGKMKNRRVEVWIRDAHNGKGNS